MEQVQQPHYQQKRKPKALLVVGLILNILSSVGYFVGLIVVFAILIAAVAIGSTTGAVIGGEQAAQDIAQELANNPKRRITRTTNDTKHHTRNIQSNGLRASHRQIRQSTNHRCNLKCISHHQLATMLPKNKQRRITIIWTEDLD